ncbi:MAG: PAS domain S-box protein [Phormidesmis sp.]
MHQLEQSSQAETSAILRSLSDVILVRDIEGRCLKVISGLTDKLYSPADQMVGKTLHESLPKTQADIILGYIQKAVHSQQSVRGEYDLVVEGKLVNFSTVFSPISDNSVVAVTHDITELKKIENQLSVHALITKTIAEGICLIRASDGTIVYNNPKFEAMFGYEPCELIGENAAILNYSDSKISGATAAEQLLKKADKQREFTCEVHSVKKDGKDFWCRATVSMLEHPEMGSVYVAVHTDITAEKRSQANVELLKSITEGINKAEDFEAALSLVLKKVSKVHGWVHGEAWTLSSSKDVLQCSPAYYSLAQENISDAALDPLAKFRELSELMTLRIGISLPGRVYKSQHPEWHVDVSTLAEDTYLRKAIALECGIKTVLGIPLVDDGQVIAVLVFFRQNADEADPHLMVNFSVIASQLSSKQSRRQLEKKLAETQELVQTALDFASDVILVLNESNRTSIHQRKY